jgi:hypothetical protein
MSIKQSFLVHRKRQMKGKARTKIGFNNIDRRRVLMSVLISTLLSFSLFFRAVFGCFNEPARGHAIKLQFDFGDCACRVFKNNEFLRVQKYFHI